jgi:acetyl-CoA carboxylase biotin carboxyl carrier protein
VDLTNDDVADILALLDSLPYDSLDVETSRFRLTLRRTPGGGWTEESQVLTEPAVVTPVPNDAFTPFPATPDISGISGRPGKQGTTVAAGAESAANDPEDAGQTAEAGRTGAGRVPDPGQVTGGAAAAGTGRANGPDVDGSAAGKAGLAVVAAPLPGTFYRAPRPGAESFVQVGDAVAADTVVAIVETMKLMNSVHAGTAGRIAQICVGNGEFAPLGSTLMLIEPDP